MGRSKDEQERVRRRRLEGRETGRGWKGGQGEIGAGQGIVGGVRQAEGYRVQEKTVADGEWWNTGNIWAETGR